MIVDPDALDELDDQTVFDVYAVLTAPLGLFPDSLGVEEWERERRKQFRSAMEIVLSNLLGSARKLGSPQESVNLKAEVGMCFQHLLIIFSSFFFSCR